jgi:hypothetical protein
LLLAAADTCACACLSSWIFGQIIIVIIMDELNAAVASLERARVVNVRD